MSYKNMEEEFILRVKVCFSDESSLALISEGWQCPTAVKHLIPKGVFWEKVS